jgi:hypothetical protein
MCTTAVAAMATGGGKKSINAGNKVVPNPNPQKKLSVEPSSAARITMTSDIIAYKAKSGQTANCILTGLLLFSWIAKVLSSIGRIIVNS